MQIFKNGIIFLLFLFISTFILAQEKSFKDYLEAGKDEFKKDFDKQNFKEAVKNLEQAVYLRPSNTEALYFLGNAYSKLNAKDGREMQSLDINLSIKASACFEKVNALEPKYEGEKYVLDPHSKITSEWGSAALYFLDKGDKDSSKWALNEGRKRGGFSDYMIHSTLVGIRDILDQSIIFSSGDNMTYPLLYINVLGLSEKKFTLIDLNMLNTIWYPEYLRKNQIADFGLTKEELEKVDYREWTDSIINIRNFEWTMVPTYYNKIVYRGDVLLLKLLQANSFKKSVYFTTAMAKNQRIGLDRYMDEGLFVDYLRFFKSKPIAIEKHIAMYKQQVSLFEKANMNSEGDHRRLDMMRTNALYIALDHFEHNKQKAIELVNLIEIGDFPFFDFRNKKYLEDIKDWVKKNKN